MRSQEEDESGELGASKRIQDNEEPGGGGG